MGEVENSLEKFAQVMVLKVKQPANKTIEILYYPSCEINV